MPQIIVDVRVCLHTANLLLPSLMVTGNNDSFEEHVHSCSSVGYFTDECKCAIPVCVIIIIMWIGSVILSDLKYMDWL